MSATRPCIAIGDGAAAALSLRAIELGSVRPPRATLAATAPADGPARRTKIWEFNPSLHCSIIGTCLSTAELRQVLKRLGLASPGSTDHELHGTAVGLAGRHDKAAKLLNKALDERHRLAIRRLAKAGAEAELRVLWQDALRQGEIPGAYWATLTHPAATRDVIRDVFGDVHMLSHLVGAANRADIRRLCQLEADCAELRERLDRQQAALRDAVVTRDTTIRELRQALARRIAAERPEADHDGAMVRQVVAELERRLAAATRRGAVLEERLTAANAIIAEERAALAKLERDLGALRSELDTIESSVSGSRDSDAAALTPAPRLDGITVLYVGGRPHQAAHLRAIAERSGAAFLHHDGGVEHHLSLLPGLTSQADIVVFPVDCISHHAAQTAKLLCRQGGKCFIPLRSAGAASLFAALRRPDIAALAKAAT